MASRKIQLLRSSQVYNSLEAAKAPLNASLANIAGLADGEMVLARYLEGEAPNQTIKAIIGIYNNKNGNAGWTVIEDTTAMAEMLADLNYPMTGDSGNVVTEVSQTDGVIAPQTTPVVDLTLDDYANDGSTNTGVIADGDTLAEALNKVENSLSALETSIEESDIAHTLVSSDSSINITTVESGADEGKTNVTVHVDGQTIQKGSQGELFTGLVLHKDNVSELPTNVRERYYLASTVEGTGEFNAITGSTPIDIYKDSALNEVYLGTPLDSVNSETGEVKHVTYTVKPYMEFIDSTTYEGLSATEKALYEEGTRKIYNIKQIRIMSQAYDALDDSVKEFYVPDDSTEYDDYIVLDEYRQVSEETYNTFTQEQQNAFDEVTENGYAIKNEYKYLDDEQHNDIYNDGQTTDTVYFTYPRSVLGGVREDVYQSLNFVYHLEDGTYQMVKIDVSKFLAETEVGNGLVNESGVISVNPGMGLGFPSTGLYGRRPLQIKIDPTSDSALSLSQDGLKLDLSDVTTNALNQVNGSSAIAVTEKSGNQQTIMLQLANRLSNTSDAQYAGLVQCTEIDGEEVCVDESNNVLQIYGDGLYLDSTWDCGEY